MMKKKIKLVMASLISIFMILVTPMQAFCEEPAADNTKSEAVAETQVSEGETEQVFKYKHDPRLDSKAMEDVVYNPDAVYGFSPNPSSGSLTAYAEYDFTDAKQVESWKAERVAYHEELNQMFKIWEDMKKEGKSVEEIARKVSEKRNQIRLDSFKNDPEGLKITKQRNLEKYGDENGPTPESLFEKYGYWEMVLIKSFSTNSGMDACLGLYDIEYDHNVSTGAVNAGEKAIYTVMSGDSLSKISKKYYGTNKKWSVIYDANKDGMKNHNTLMVGQELVIPLD